MHACMYNTSIVHTPACKNTYLTYVHTCESYLFWGVSRKAYQMWKHSTLWNCGGKQYLAGFVEVFLGAAMYIAARLGVVAQSKLGCVHHPAQRGGSGGDKKIKEVLVFLRNIFFFFSSPCLLTHSLTHRDVLLAIGGGVYLFLQPSRGVLLGVAGDAVERNVRLGSRRVHHLPKKKKKQKRNRKKKTKKLTHKIWKFPSRRELCF